MSSDDVQETLDSDLCINEELEAFGDRSANMQLEYLARLSERFNQSIFRVALGAIMLAPDDARDWSVGVNPSGFVYCSAGLCNAVLTSISKWRSSEKKENNNFIIQ